MKQLHLTADLVMIHSSPLRRYQDGCRSIRPIQSRPRTGFYVESLRDVIHIPKLVSMPIYSAFCQDLRV